MAQIFETEQDRIEQEKVLKWLESKGKTIVRTPQFAHVDAYYCEHGLIVRAIEVKRRYSEMGKENPFKISVKKIENCKRLAESLNTALHLIVQWDDKIGFLEILRGQTFYREAGGRTPREGSANDWEIMYHIPLGLFKVMDRRPE